MEERFRCFYLNCQLKTINFSYLIGWSLGKVLYVEVNINKFSRFLIHASHSIYHEKERCVKVENWEYFCFAWFALSALFPVAAKASYRKNSNLTILQLPHFQLRSTNITSEYDVISARFLGIENVKK